MEARSGSFQRKVVRGGWGEDVHAHGYYCDLGAQQQQLWQAVGNAAQS
jgi:hypothetical protein